jgi:hypothetical protein
MVCSSTGASGFQERRRERRQQQILLLLAGIRDEFEGLLVRVEGQLQGLADLADRLRSVERAVTLAKRYRQLAGEARLKPKCKPRTASVNSLPVVSYPAGFFLR